MTDRASLADAIEYAIVGACNCVHIGNKSPEPDAHYETCRYRVLRLASDALRTPPDHAALVQALLATCDRLGMTNIPADAPAAFARVLGEFGAKDDDETYEIGKRDGYESAIQDLDLATGGDGEFRGSTLPGRTVDVPVMKQRIIARLNSQPPAIPATAWAALLGAFEKHKQQDQGRSDADAIWDAVIREINGRGEQ